MSLQFRSFTRSDWDGLAGCTGEDPKIAEHANEIGSWQLIADEAGATISLYAHEGTMYEWLIETNNQLFSEAILDKVTIENLKSIDYPSDAGFVLIYRHKD